MQILHLSSAKTWRGGEQQIAYLMLELRKKGIRQWLLCAKGSQMEAFCKKEAFEHFTYHKAFSWNPLVALKIRRLCKKLGTTHLHAHDAHAHTFAVISAAFFGNKTPIIVTRRVDFPVGGGFFSRWKYNHPAVRKIVCVSHFIRNIMTPAIDDHSKLVVVHSGVKPRPVNTSSGYPLIAVSPPQSSPAPPYEGGELKAPYLESKGFSVKKLAGCSSPPSQGGAGGDCGGETANNPYSSSYRAERLLRKEFNIPENEFLIANIAVIAPHKDYFTFVCTTEILVRQGFPAKYLIIGGDGGEEQYIRQFIREKGLENHIILTGFRKDIAVIFPEIDLLLFTSKTEGLGTTILDAFLNQVPVIATAAGGIPEMVEHEKTGMLAPVGDAETLAVFVRKVLENSGLRETLVSNALEKAGEFSVEKMAEGMVAVYANSPGDLKSPGE